MSLWFVSAAILPDMLREGELSPIRQAALSSGVQAGFVIGALVSAVLGLADRFDPRRVFAASAIGAGLVNAVRRRRLAAYFTPPHLAPYAIDVLVEAGIKPGQHRILDPASGGAAFLVPLATRIAAQGRQRGARAKTILQSIKDTLHGVEIDAGLAKLSQALLADLLDAEIETSGVELDGLVDRAKVHGKNRRASASSQSKAEEIRG